ncbi:MAG: methylenetetrahydrofolate reductase [NAD(P)H] [Elusimicrobia bacterium]|nr:methylenetetrahydrofolate reductase [NAD(P)H] [Elusimicrobiota bacterium]
MKISEVWKKKPTTFSFEFFPPKTDEEGALVLDTARSLKPLGPDYISVTWGAGGGTRRKTLDLVSAIKNDVGIESMAHLTCVGAGRHDIDEILEDMGRRGVHNILALRGDPPRGSAQFEPHPDGFRHASELVRHIRSRLDVCLGVAGYPEGHPECPDLNKDLDHLKFKVDQGADFVVTQLFFDPSDFLRFRDRASARGVRVPIVAGVMPITNVGQVKRFTTLCGARIPSTLESALDRVQSDAEAVIRLGIDHAVQQCRALLAEGVGGIHFYTLNRSRSTTEILRHLRPSRQSI